MDIKLEGARGEAVHAADIPAVEHPPEVMVWNGRVFRLLRTDGVWDKKKHVYREASVHDLGHAPDANGAPDALLAANDSGPDAGADAGPNSGPNSGPQRDKKARDDRQFSAVLNAGQAALLKRVRTRGAFGSNKAAVLAGLEALDEQLMLSNEALLQLLAERLETRQ